MPALVPARRAPPRGLRDLRHQAAYLFGAVCPERDAGVALVLPCGGAAAMQAMLDELSQAVSSGAHAVVLMDRAGARHLQGALLVVLTPQMLPLTPQLSPTVAPIAPPAASGCTQPGEMRVSGAGITSSRRAFQRRRACGRGDRGGYAPR